MSDAGPDVWKAPGSGTPLKPDEAAAAPSPVDLVAGAIRKLIVPKGPQRTVAAMIGGSIKGGFVANALNSAITLPILAAPGVITQIDILCNIITTAAASGVLQLWDGDSNAPLLRNFPVSFGAAGSFNLNYSCGPSNLPFLSGILATWTPIVGAFGNSLIGLNIDFNSIPIGQRDV